MFFLNRSFPTGRPLAYHLHLAPAFRRRNLSLILSPPFIFPHSDIAACSGEDQQLRTEPQPHNFNFLEELSAEYGNIKRLQASSSLTSREAESVQAEKHKSRLLAKLIYHRDFERARVLRDEFLKSNAGINPHGGFVMACHHALNIIDAEQRAHTFLGWLSLVPIKRRPFILRPMIRHLMRHPFDLILLMDACIIFARQGFLKALVDQPNPRLLMHIFRYGHPTATTAFLLKLEREAQEHPYAGQADAWKYIRGIAIKAHLSAGRGRIAKTLYNSAVDNASIEAETHKRLERFRSTGDFYYKNVVIPPASLRRYGLDSINDKGPTPSMLAKELRILRRAVVSGPSPPDFESFLADFMHSVDGLKGRRSRAIDLLRRRAWTRGSIAVRARWVASELLYYSSLRRPLAVLRTFNRFCFSDHILCHELERVLKVWLERETDFTKLRLDWLSAQKYYPVLFKIWPSSISIKLAWKAVLQLSETGDLERLYNHFLSYVEAVQSMPKNLPAEIRLLLSSSDTATVDRLYFNRSRSFLAAPASSVPDATSFHTFVVAFSTRISPRRGMEVLADMSRLGFKPHLNAWGAVAGAYARSGDELRAFKLLNYVDVAAGLRDPELMTARLMSDGEDMDVDEVLSNELETGEGSQLDAHNDGDSLGEFNPYEQCDMMAAETDLDDDVALEASGEQEGEELESQRLSQRIQRSVRASYNSLIRGFTECGHFAAARRVQRRGWALGIYNQPIDKRTRSVFHRLASYEQGKWDGMLVKRNVVEMDGNRLYVDPQRTDWAKETVAG